MFCETNIDIYWFNLYTYIPWSLLMFSDILRKIAITRKINIFEIMKTLIVYPDTEDKLQALKTFMQNHKIHFKTGMDHTAHSIADDIREAVEEVKLHREGKIKLQDARDLLHEL